MTEREIKVGDFVDHPSRDSHAWRGRVLLIEPEKQLGERHALVELDTPYMNWSRWRLVPLRTLKLLPPKCESAYIIASQLTGVTPGWTAPTAIVHCLLDQHSPPTRHYSKSGYGKDAADIFWG